MSDDETMPPPEKPKRRRSAKVVKPPVAVEVVTPAEAVELPVTVEAVEPVHDQAFFLDLARPREDSEEARGEARERWNAWRRDSANAEVRVTFEGVDFREGENAWISFAGFEFGDRARFEGASFGDEVSFVGGKFGHLTRFSGATFGAGVQFSCVSFGEMVQFVGATFVGDVYFSSATFARGATFNRANFGIYAYFTNAMFGDHPSFIDSTFGSWAHFKKVRFGKAAHFEGATFGENVQFDGAVFGPGADFSGRTGDADIEARRRDWQNAPEAEQARVEKAYRRWRDASDHGPAKFSVVSFASARFLGDVTFARRSFERPADFTNVRFDAPPDFDGATNLQRIDFTGARVGFVGTGHTWWKPDWTTKSSIAIRLRALRSQIEATKNHDFERDLYIEERKAERGIHLARLWRAVRFRRSMTIARAFLATLPRPPRIDVFADKDRPVVMWPERRPNRRGEARPAMIAGGPAEERRRRAYRQHGLRVLRALLPLLVHLVWIAVMAVYWAFADYGRSWVRPAVWLVASLLAFHGGWSIEGIDARLLSERRAAAIERVVGDEARTAVAAQYDEAVRLYSVANSIPFVGPLTVDGDVKKFLFCGETGKGVETAAASEPKPRPCVPLPPRGFQLATIGQNLLSILLVFFMGLALRNYFRLK